MGFKPGGLWDTPVALLESIASLMVFVSFFTWLAVIGFLAHMITGTIWKITKTDKPFTEKRDIQRH